MRTLLQQSRTRKAAITVRPPPGVLSLLCWTPLIVVTVLVLGGDVLGVDGLDAGAGETVVLAAFGLLLYLNWWLIRHATAREGRAPDLTTPGR